MRIISPRLHHLLLILIYNETPVSVQQMSEELGVSTRTVFRELNNIDLILAPYNLSLGTKVGKGMYLKGDKKQIDAFSKELETIGNLKPVHKEDRRASLVIQLLTEKEQQKLFYYANLFDVSQATISSDLDYIESWLEKYNIQLYRRPGLGILVKGNETDIRDALCAELLSLKRGNQYFYSRIDFPAKEVEDKINLLFETRFIPHIGMYTEDSIEMIKCYITVAVQRILAHNHIEFYDKEADSYFTTHANSIGDILEMQFGIFMSEEERKYLSMYLAASRFQTKLKREDTAEHKLELRQLAYKMIELYDPEQSALLKLDDQLVEGLVQHLGSAVHRVKNNLEIQDPLSEQITQFYPNTLKKSKKAVTALSKYSESIAESEASFLVTHFGAADMRLKEHGKTRTKAYVAVVCSSGIGTSYFIASQLKKHFGNKIETEVFPRLSLQKMEAFDFIIATVPIIESTIPVVEVSPLLTDDEIDKIQNTLDHQTLKNISKLETRTKDNLIEWLKYLELMLSDMQAILTGFDVLEINDDCTIEQLAELAGYRFGDTSQSGRQIYQALIKREELSTQVVPDLELILLHSRTEGVNKPVFGVIVPQGDYFTDLYLKRTRSCVIMLAPIETSRSRGELIGAISSSLVQDDDFYNAVIAGDKDGIYLGLERIVKNFYDDKLIYGKI